MNQHLLMHTVMRYQNPDSPELARRRENLTLFEPEAREARRRRRSEFTNRLLNALSASRRADTDEQMRRCERPAAGEARRKRSRGCHRPRQIG
jgi:hypothetical protein